MAKILSKEIISDSESDSSSVPAPKPSSIPPFTMSDSQKQQKKKAKSGKHVMEVSDSSSESESEESENIASPEENSANQFLTRPSAVPPEAFKPPLGFKAATKRPSSSSKTSSLLSNLQSKRVFYVTAPAFLPLSAVREVALSKAMRGEPVLTHNGVDYGVPADHQQQLSSPTLLLYNESSRTYKTVPAEGTQCYHIQELISLPGCLTGANRESDGHLPGIQGPSSSQPQPKHLKMRFRPIGSRDAPPETIGTSSEESEVEENAFKFPRGWKDQEKPKRKYFIQGDKHPELNESPRKESKKHPSMVRTGDVPSSSDSSQPHPSTRRNIKKDHDQRNTGVSQKRKSDRKQESR